jgi:hypothetical protein
MLQDRHAPLSLILLQPISPPPSAPSRALPGESGLSLLSHRVPFCWVFSSHSSLAGRAEACGDGRHTLLLGSPHSHLHVMYYALGPFSFLPLLF